MTFLAEDTALFIRVLVFSLGNVHGYSTANQRPSILPGNTTTLETCAAIVTCQLARDIAS